MKDFEELKEELRSVGEDWSEKEFEDLKQNIYYCIECESLRPKVKLKTVDGALIIQKFLINYGFHLRIENTGTNSYVFSIAPLYFSKYTY